MDVLRRLLDWQPDDGRQKRELDATPKSVSGAEASMEVGDSPVPGLALRNVIKAINEVCRIAWSPDKQVLAVAPFSNNITVWDVQKSALVTEISLPKGDFNWGVVWSSDGLRLALAKQQTARVFDTSSWEMLRDLRHPSLGVYSPAFTDGGNILVTANYQSLFLWEIYSENEPEEVGFEEHVRLLLLQEMDGQLKRVVLATEERIGGESFNVCWYDMNSRLILGSLTLPGSVNVLLSSSDQKYIICGGDDGSIRFVNNATFKEDWVLEGHSSSISSLSFSADARVLISTSRDGVIKLWSYSASGPASLLQEFVFVEDTRAAFHPHLPLLATASSGDGNLRIWEVDTDLLLRSAPAAKSVNYTTAKVVLVGDSGVGKTGLGWRMAKGEFKEHPSTHGQQFWVVDQLGLTREDGTQCEAVLWDLAGQHVYRPVHSIFLDDVDASLVLFDPTNRQEPLKGAQFWLEQLKGKGRLPPAVLVGARLDRGQPVITRQELDQFCQHYGVSGGYIGTSAATGEGVEQLMAAVKAMIPWDRMTTTVTTETFKRIKDFVLALKERTDRKGILVQPAQLRAQLEASDPEWRFSDAEMLTAVGHLQNHGYVTLLRSSSGEAHILLAPDVLVSLASSIVLQADRHARELGAVSENDLLQGRYPLDELRGMGEAEQQILIDAAVLLFLHHNICFRETLDSDTLLIFPGLIKQKRPLADDAPTVDDGSYIVRGRVENLFPMLVVLLGYTPSFTRINQWQRQAQYELGPGEICGFRMIEEREGELELVISYGERVPERGREQFLELFELFLYQRDVEVERFPPVLCPVGHRQKRATVVERVRQGKSFAFCDECGRQVELAGVGRPSLAADDDPLLRLEGAMARLQSLYEAHLVAVKGYRRAWALPRCHLSCVPGHEALVSRITRDLQNAGVYIVEGAADVAPEDYVVLLFSDAYRAAWRDPATAADERMALVKRRLAGDKRRLLRIALDVGQPVTHDHAGCKPGDFSDETHYPVSLLDLVLTLYAIPLDHAAFRPLRRSLHQLWEQLPRERVVERPADAPAPAAARAASSPAERYVDFELHIAPGGHATASSPEGEDAAKIALEPPAPVDLSLTLIEQGVVSARLYRDLGLTLYGWLLPGPLHTLFERTETRARGEGAKVRLRLRIEPPSIARLPVELIYRASRGQFLGIDPTTVVSRYLQLPLPRGRARLREGPLHMLLLVASPAGLPAIDAAEWERLMGEALAGPIAAGALTLEVVRVATRTAIRDALARRKPDILQIAAHGLYEQGQGQIALVGEDGRAPWRLEDERFANLLRGHDDNLGLIALCTCASGRSNDPQGFRGLAPQLVQRCGVPAVIAMQYDITMPAARTFFADFYAAVAARKPVDWAVQAGRNAVSQVHGLDSREFIAPVLYMRAGDGEIF